MFRLLFILSVAVWLSACNTIIQQHVVLHPSLPVPGSRHVAVFLDGTANDSASRTNVIRLFEIMSNQDRADVASFYNEGVGTGARLIGAVTGAGIATDIEEAYDYLLREYAAAKDPSYIHLHFFGFSRGAFTARALAGLVWTAGIPMLHDTTSDYWRRQLVYEVYKAYHYMPGTEAERKAHVQAVYNSDKWKGRIKRVVRDIPIDTLGLWDTVESLGLRGLGEAVLNDNRHYADQLCNVKRVLHAMSLEDNRAEAFAPLLLNLPQRWADCPQQRDKTVLHEVWFAGAHADVGGGYDDDGGLSGVSLNWMLQHLAQPFEPGGRGLVAPGTRVWEDTLAIAHDAQGSNFLYRAILAREHRPLHRYLCKMNGGRPLKAPGLCSVPVVRPLQLHDSVRLRRKDCAKNAQPREASQVARNTWQFPMQDRSSRQRDCNFNSGWFEQYPFAGCVPEDGQTAEVPARCAQVIQWVR
jgi:Uncharacterized alpha/beta hydrolase domain (DUF2235)